MRPQTSHLYIKLKESVFTKEQKQEMIQKVTDTMVSIKDENMRPVTWVVLEEVKSGNCRIAGKGYTTEDVITLAEGK
jgi:4-oxalocrotonate tautomerase